MIRAAAYYADLPENKPFFETASQKGLTGKGIRNVLD
jgi:hypothetical protein